MIVVRFCTLLNVSVSTNLCRYCASREEQTNRKSISLVGADPIARSRQYKHTFEINTPLRLYILAAGSAAEMNSWISILNAQRKDANQNNDFQLAEFFTSDYENSRTNKEHRALEVCVLRSVVYLLVDLRQHC